jgi:HD-like signal output (HDOD) protein
MHEPLPFITRAASNLQGWLRMFDAAQLPVLATTANRLEELRFNEDAVDAHLLSQAVGDDPLMIVKLLSHVAKLRKGRDNERLGSDTETITEALVMSGIAPFFRTFGPQGTVEEHLHGHADALEGFMRVLQRSRRAARFALGFAVHRMDTNAAVIHEAALLRDLAELLLWLRAPALAHAVLKRQQSDPGLRSSVAQRELLNISLDELGNALLVAWKMPSLVIKITDETAKTTTSSMRNVHLAVRVARHSAAGWQNAALPDDYRDIGALLNLASSHVQKLLLDIDAG